MTLTPHARRQCEQRDFPIEDVLRVAARKLAGATARSAAVLIGWVREERGALIGSNGSEVWAIVREGELVTVMLRRADQPRTRGALRVEEVFA
jgi:hypothetical protein